MITCMRTSSQKSASHLHWSALTGAAEHTGRKCSLVFLQYSYTDTCFSYLATLWSTYYKYTSDRAQPISVKPAELSSSTISLPIVFCQLEVIVLTSLKLTHEELIIIS